MSETAAPCDFTECENNDRHLWPETSPVDAPEEKLFVTSAGGIGINIGGHVIVRPLREWHRLAASQPDREAVKEFIASASFASRSSLDSDTIFCEIYTPGYQPAKKGSFGFFVKELRAILSLLSGAGTKSDGGVEADTRANETAKALMAHPSPMGSRSCDEKTIACGVAGVAPGPSDPSPGPDVRRRVLDILNVVAPAVENLAGHQEQCDMDGVMVKVSRQALDEVLNAVNEVALVSALQSVEGGVQGSSADGQHCNEQFGRGLSPAFGIIDPDYARIFTIARCVAWAEGYAIAMHGSFTRDLDLIAVPWARHACEPEHLARRIESAAGLKISVHPKNDKPFGRLVWTMTLPNFGDPRFVDLSIIPRSSIEQDGQAELLEEEQRMIDLAWETHKAARPIDASTLAEEIRIQMNVRKTCVVSGVEALAKGLIEAFTITQLTKTPSADHDAGNLRGLAEPTPRDSSESTTGGVS